MQTASKCRIHFKFCVNVMATGHWPACVNIVTLYFVTKTWNNLYEKVLQNRLRIVLCSCQCGMCVQSKACSCSFGNSHFLDTSGICWLSPNNAYKAKAWNWFQVRRWFCFHATKCGHQRLWNYLWWFPVHSVFSILGDVLLDTFSLGKLPSRLFGWKWDRHWWQLYRPS